MSFTHQGGAFHNAADGAQLYYELKGNPQGFPLLFLHGGTCDMSSFNGLLEILGETYRCIGLDSRGHGRSTLGDAPLSYALLQQDVESLLVELNIESCHVIGHSDGGIVALRMAADHVSCIEKVVTIGAHWTTNDPEMKGAYADISPEFWRKYLPHLVEQYEQLNEQPDFDRLLARLTRMWLDTSSDGYPDERVRLIDNDIMVMRGDNDPLVSLDHTVGLVNRLKKRNFLNMPFGRHSVHEEAPALLAKIAMDFLA